VVCTKSGFSHVALHEHNSSTEKLESCSKDSASLLVCNEIKFFLVLCFRFFVSYVISGVYLGHVGPFHLGPNCWMVYFAQVFIGN